jgi:hypothetical protein
MDLFYYKLIAAPVLVALATLAGRRWGPTMAGLVAGLPIVAGPILYFYALEQGPTYAAAAAHATLLGLLSLCFFTLAYSWRAWASGSALSATLLGWVAFAFSTMVVRHMDVGLVKALLYAAAGLFLARRSLPAMGEPGPDPRPGAWDLPLRMLAAALLVFVLTHFAGGLGPKLGGLLAPFPVASTVLAVFAHRHRGGAAAVAVLKGMLLALNAFAVFCAALVLTLPSQSIPVSFSISLAAACLVQGLLMWFSRKR